ncbi:MAG: hypothetical protein M0R51_14330 [Clostridia bacterium]|jgi:Na+/proline symporter|nr:hypothetical protein [Clostridia bacterium]
MTDWQRVRNAFDSGVLSILEKLALVFYYWLFGGISSADATDFFLECGYTFIIPNATGIIILTGITSTYTIVSLITQYNTDAYPQSFVGSDSMLEMIRLAYSKGYITDTEKTQLEELPW